MLWLSAAPAVRADVASGVWTGTLEGRGNYYWETSTRVLVPEGHLQLESPDGLRLGAGYLVDVISSASIAQGVGDDEVFTELRHGVEGNVGKEFDLGDLKLDLSARASYSTENDYKSLIYSLTTGLSFDERNTKLELSAAGVNDDVQASNDPDFEGELDGISLSVGLQQVLSPIMELGLGYQFAVLDGFLGNPYRSVQAGGAPVREAPPDTRYRHNANVRLKIFVPPTDTTVAVGYRGYIDSWEITALTPELRVYQAVFEGFLLEAGYRYYRQTSAYFIELGDGQYPRGYQGPTTDDPKLDDMVTHTMTFGAALRLDFLAETFLDFAQGSWIDLQVSRYLSTSTFGNGVIASAGGRLTF